MAYLYTATLPDSGKSRLLTGDGHCVVTMPPPRAPMDRIERTLRRRIDTAIERRRAAAITIDDTLAFREWTYQRDRESKLTRALIAYLSRPF